MARQTSATPGVYASERSCMVLRGTFDLTASFPFRFLCSASASSLRLIVSPKLAYGSDFDSILLILFSEPEALWRSSYFIETGHFLLENSHITQQSLAFISFPHFSHLCMNKHRSLGIATPCLRLQKGHVRLAIIMRTNFSSKKG